MFSQDRKDHTKALLRFCIDTMYEVATYGYGREQTKQGSADAAMDFQLCTGATYILIKIVGYIMKDHNA